jgi:hypothetical protein
MEIPYDDKISYIFISLPNIFKMISCKLAGGLGNQLFQIFTAIAYALKYSKPFFFLNNHQLGDGSSGVIIRYTYWETFLSSLKPFLRGIDSIPQLMFIKENQQKTDNHSYYEKIDEYFSSMIIYTSK